MPDSTVSSNGTYVYVATDGKYVKIGLSAAPVRRIGIVAGDRWRRPEIAADLVMVHIAAGDRRDEIALQKSLRQHRVIGEWFDAACMNERAMKDFLRMPFSVPPPSATIASKPINKERRTRTTPRPRTVGDKWKGCRIGPLHLNPKASEGDERYE